jgi:hypothetical protein
MIPAMALVEATNLDPLLERRGALPGVMPLVPPAGPGAEAPLLPEEPLDDPPLFPDPLPPAPLLLEELPGDPPLLLDPLLPAPLLVELVPPVLL